MASNKKKTILFVEDDLYLAMSFVERLQADGYRVVTARSGKTALEEIRDRRGMIDAAILDIMLPWDRATRNPESGKLTGWILAKRLRKEYPHIKLIGFSALGDESVVKWFEEYGAGYIQKPARSVEVLDAVHYALYGKARRKPKCFVVHGHDERLLKDLIFFLRKDLTFKDIIVLREQPSLGRTVIEKFEDLASDIDLAFVLLTPDDMTLSMQLPDREKRRARQNVIFELGYFYAHLQREKGRVILLYKGELDLPSDISGVVYVDVTGGISAAKRKLREEMGRWIR